MLNNDRNRRFFVKFFPIILLGLIVVAFFIPRPTQPPVAQLLALGHYEMTLSQVILDERINDPARFDWDERGRGNAYFHFELCNDFPYFKMTIHHNYPGDASAFINLGIAHFSNGQFIDVGPSMWGNTQIIYTPQPWSAGWHYLSLHAQTLGDVGEVHIQIATAATFDEVSAGLLLPHPDEFFTLTITSATPQYINFEIANNTEHKQQLLYNYWIYTQRQMQTWRDRMARGSNSGGNSVTMGLIRYYVAAGEVYNHHDYWRQMDDGMPPGIYYILFHRIDVQWTNNNGLHLRSNIPLYAQFTIE